MLKMVVLPAPFGPMSPLMSPSGNSNEAPFTARRTRNDFDIARTSSRAIAPPPDELHDARDGEDPEQRRDQQQVDANVAFAAAQHARLHERFVDGLPEPEHCRQQRQAPRAPGMGGAEKSGRHQAGERPLDEADEGQEE